MRYSNKKYSNNTDILEIKQYIKNADTLMPVLDAFSYEGPIWSEACNNLKKQNKENITMCDVVKEIKENAIKEAVANKDEIIAKIKADKDEEIAKIKADKDEEIAKMKADKEKDTELIAALQAKLEQYEKQ